MSTYDHLPRTIVLVDMADLGNMPWGGPIDVTNRDVDRLTGTGIVLRINSIRRHNLHCPLLELCWAQLNDKQTGGPRGFSTKTAEGRAESLEFLRKSEADDGPGHVFTHAGPQPKRLLIGARAPVLTSLAMTISSLAQPASQAFIATDWQLRQEAYSPATPGKTPSGRAMNASILLPVYPDESHRMMERIGRRAGMRHWAKGRGGEWERGYRLTTSPPVIQDLRMAWVAHDAVLHDDSMDGASRRQIQKVSDSFLEMVRQAIKNNKEGETAREWAVCRGRLASAAVGPQTWRAADLDEVFIASVAKMWGIWPELDAMLASSRV